MSFYVIAAVLRHDGPDGCHVKLTQAFGGSANEREAVGEFTLWALGKYPGYSIATFAVTQITADDIARAESCNRFT